MSPRAGQPPPFFYPRDQNAAPFTKCGAAIKRSFNDKSGFSFSSEPFAFPPHPSLPYPPETCHKRFQFFTCPRFPSRACSLSCDRYHYYIERGANVVHSQRCRIKCLFLPMLHKVGRMTTPPSTFPSRRTIRQAMCRGAKLERQIYVRPGLPQKSLIR